MAHTSASRALTTAIASFSSATQSPFGLALTSEDGLRVLPAPVAGKAVTRGYAECSHQRVFGSTLAHVVVGRIATT